MRGFLLGLIFGVALGAGGYYLADTQPWKGSASGGPPEDAGVEVAQDESAPKQPKKPRRASKRRSGGAAGEAGDDIPELTAADRQLLRKGPKIELPPRELDFQGGADARPLAAGEINRVIQGSSKAVIGCITEARGNAPLEARITLELLVDGDGRVQKVAMEAPRYLFAHGFEGCARSAARAMSFPATGAHTVVTAPFTLTY